MFDGYDVCPRVTTHLTIPRYADIRFVRLASPKVADAFLESLRVPALPMSPWIEVHYPFSASARANGRAARAFGTIAGVSRSAVYITLRRLEGKGLLSSWMSEPVSGPGGKRRRCVKVESEGIRLLRESHATLDQMWKGLDPALQDYG